MKPPRFDYYDPSSLDEVKQLLVNLPEAKLLAGGQSLVPLLNMRLARPSALVDLQWVPGLSYIRDAGDHLAVGAMTRQRQVELSPLVSAGCPLLAQALRHVGHVQIRNRGTIGGSLAHADPAAELPAVAAALNATLVLDGPAGRREVSAAGFFFGYFATALDPGELLLEVRWPKAVAGANCAFVEVARRSGDFALCAVAAQVTQTQGRVSGLQVALTGVGPGPVVPDLSGLIDSAPTDRLLAEAARLAAAAAEPDSDLHATADHRSHLAAVLTRRALTAALGQDQPLKGGASA